MKLKTLFISLLVVTLFSCNSDKKPQKEKEQEVKEIVSAKEFIENYLIESSSAGDFKVGGEMIFPKDNQNAKVEKKVDTLMDEGYEYEETTYNLSGNEEPLLVLKAAYDNETGLATEKIDEIKVFSGKFKTAQGIGVGATLDEFISKYPTYKIWYGYLNDSYVLETDGLNVQFILSVKDCINQPEATGEQMFLNRNDFKETAKIVQIRIF